MSARKVAAGVLLRVWEQESYAAAALSAALGRSDLAARDRGLCTEIVYGVLRTQGHLERSIEQFGKLKRSDGFLRAQLLVAAYQIAFLDRVPARAAVCDAVDLISARRGARVGGFANALLRALAQECADKRPQLCDAIVSSTPSWIRKRLERDVGKPHARALLCPADRGAPADRSSFRLFLRLLCSPSEIPWLATDCSPCEPIPGAFAFLAPGDPRARPEYAAGKFVVQELGAQIVGHALGAQKGERVLDVCAGRGQKSTLLGQRVGSEGRVVACDVHEHKLSALREEAERLGLAIETLQIDWTQPVPSALLDHFDRVLVDAPCSGLGTLRRRPEIARRLQANDPQRLSQLQVAIATQAASTLRPGGTLLFCTCSVLREEGEQSVEKLIAATDLEPVAYGTVEKELLAYQPSSTLAEAPVLQAQSVGAAGSVPLPGAARLLPPIQGTDGYFLQLLQRPL